MRLRKLCQTSPSWKDAGYRGSRRYAAPTAESRITRLWLRTAIENRAHSAALCVPRQKSIHRTPRGTGMNAFQVWLRPLGERCRLRVSGVQNAEWLLQRLGQSIALSNTEVSPEASEPEIFTFEVPCKEPKSRSRLESLLASIPEVKLMMRPE